MTSSTDRDHHVRFAQQQQPQKETAEEKQLIEQTHDDSKRAEFLYWFCGLLPAMGRTLSPLVVLTMNVLDTHSAKKNIDSEGFRKNQDRLYNKLVSEFSRQYVKGVLGVATYFGFAELVQAGMNAYKKHKGKPATSDDDANANFWKTITGQLSTTAISVFGGTLFVPLEKFLEIRDEKLKKGQPLSPRQIKVHNFLDRHLKKEGVPKLAKAAIFFTLVQAATSSSVALAMYGLTRFSGADAKRKEKLKAKLHGGNKPHAEDKPAVSKPPTPTVAPDKNNPVRGTRVGTPPAIPAYAPVAAMPYGSPYGQQPAPLFR